MVNIFVHFKNKILNDEYQKNLSDSNNKFKFKLKI